MMTTPPLVSRQFIPHQRCAKVVPEAHLPHNVDDEDNNGGAGTPEGGIPETVTTWDFGIIKVRNPSWVDGESGVPTTNVAFAPMYSRAELESMAEKFSSLQPVCLNIGWGDTNREGTDSNSIRGGWTQLISRQECIEYSATSKHGFQDLTEDEIRKYMTWICSDRFPLNFRNPGPLDNGGATLGDSGDPVTCNNAYVAIVQGVFTFRELSGTGEDAYWASKRIMFPYSAIKFTLFENASNYRRQFDILVGQAGGVYREIIRELMDRFGDDFVDHVEEAIFEEGVEHFIEQAIEAVAVRSGNIMANNTRSHSRLLKQPPSITRQMSFERVIQSFSDKLYVSSVLLVFILIAMPILKYDW